MFFFFRDNVTLSISAISFHHKIGLKRRYFGANKSKAYCSSLELRGRLTLSSGSLYIKQCAAVTIHCLSISAPPQIKDTFPKYEKML